MKCINKECEYRVFNGGDDIGDFYYCELVGITVERGNDECLDDKFKLDEHVYCTQCKWFRLDDEDIPYCPWEDRCEIRNCEDSMQFRDRPYWEKLEK